MSSGGSIRGSHSWGATMDAVDAAISGPAAWSAAAVAAYLVLGLLACLCGRVPGTTGRAADAVLRRCYPRLVSAAMRALVAAAVGGTVLDAGAAAAVADEHPRPP